MLYTNAACWTTILLNALLLSHCIAVDSNLAYGDITGLAQRIDRLSAWFARPKQLPDVKPLLPDARPTQPWPYRKLDAATAYSVSLTSTHAILATVTHAPVPGVTGDMMLWWFREGVYGRSYYSGNEWDNYIRWHPQHHIYQRIKQPADGGSETPHSSPSAAAATTAAAKGSSSHPKPMLWEICEFMTSANPNGYTTGNFPGPEATAQEYFVKAVAEIRQLDHKGLWATVPTRTGLGPTIWNLKHEWADSPAGLAINSTQVVGVIDSAWRPLWFARLRNAIPRGLFGQGRDPTWMLSQWIRHCVEEIGNLQHILPDLYHQASADIESAVVGSSQAESCNKRSQPDASTLSDEL